jgi:hypothetical protein
MMRLRLVIPREVMIDWPHWARAAVVILIVCIITFALLLFLPDAAGEAKKDAAHPQPACFTAEERSRVLALAYKAYDDALENHLEHLFAVFLQDPAGEPVRAQRGTQNGIAAWVQARKLTAKWSPPPC